MKRLISLLIAILILLCSLPLTAFAEETISGETVATTDEYGFKISDSDFIYYTDLFYAYSAYLPDDAFYLQYKIDIENVYETVYSNYAVSADKYGTALNYALDTITSPTALIGFVTDTLGFTDTEYYEALDAANELFISKLMTETGIDELDSAYGKTGEIIDNCGEIVDVFNSLDLKSKANNTSYSAEAFLEQAVSELKDKKILSGELAQSVIDELLSEISAEGFELKDYFTLASTEVDIARALTTAIMLENVRLDIIDSILDSQTSDTVLKQGMTRLKKQVTSGFVARFITAYIKGGAADKIHGMFNDFVIEKVFDQAQFNAVLKIINAVVFDLLTDVPEFGDVLKFQVLRCYSEDLGDAIKAKAETFDDGPFLSNEIIQYENMFIGYSAANASALEVLQTIAEANDPYGEVYAIFTEAQTAGAEYVTVTYNGSSYYYDPFSTESEIADIIATAVLEEARNMYFSNGTSDLMIRSTDMCSNVVFMEGSNNSLATISAFNGKYADKNVYENHIKTVTDLIYLIPAEERECISREIYGEWTYSYGITHQMTLQSNIAEENKVYAVNGYILGNIHLTGSYSATIAENTNITIDGNVTLDDGGFFNGELVNNGILRVVGNFTIGYRNSLTNNNELSVYGELSCSGFNAYIDNFGVIRAHDCILYQDNKGYEFSDNSQLYVSGNYSCSWNLGGTVIFNGKEQQSVAGLKSNHIIVDNPNGLKYLSDVGVYGLYELNGNPIELNGNDTLAYNDARFDNSDYGTIVSKGLLLKDSLNSDIVIDSKSLMTIPEGFDVIVNGNITLDEATYSYTTLLKIEGTLTVNGNVTVDYYCSLVNSNLLVVNGTLNSIATTKAYVENSGTITTRDCILYSKDKDHKFSSDSKLYVSGNYAGDCILEGTIFFNGTERQTVKGLKAYHIIVENPNGLKYLSNVHLYGKYDLNHSPLELNGYCTYAYNNSRFDNSEYHTIQAEDLILTDTVNADIIIPCKGSMIVPNSADITVKGDIVLEDGYLNSSTVLTVNGTLRVDGDVTVNYRTTLTNNGELTVNGKLESKNTSYAYVRNRGIIKTYNCLLYSNKKTHSFYADSQLYVSGNYEGDSLLEGSVILNGTEQQTVKGLKANTVLITNESEEGVVFSNAVNVYELFNHNGNNFTLYNNGSGSYFVDYDGDGELDNVDPEPTVGLPCVINITSDNTEQGIVSADVLETIGGTKHTVTATPTFKYKFVKWVNSSGNTVSTDAEYTFVAKGDDTLTAYFEKRSQPITATAEGGVINAPSRAVIESEVVVSVTENEGHIYTEGSLSYNGTPIENGTFVMPDEPVTITAEFVYNEYYFALKNKLTEAHAVTYESYSAESFAVLTNAIAEAEGALQNHITQEISDTHIAALQQAMDGLADKYIVSVSAVNSPVIYIGVDSIMTDLQVKVNYDNGTSESITDFTVEGFDCNVAGEQEIKVKYQAFETKTVVTVLLRQITDIAIEAIPDVLYIGKDAVYEPPLTAYYKLNGDTLAENTDYIVTYTDNTAPGTATVTVTGTGKYTGSVTVEFTIYCEHSYETAEYIAPACTENGYRKYVCTVCGDVSEELYQKVFTEGLPESSHNYANNTDITYTYTVENAVYLDLLFSSSTLVENSCDKIYIYDGNGTQVGVYTGNALASATVRVTGDTVKLRITSDVSVTKYGFSLQSVTAYLVGIAATGHTAGEWVTEKEPTVTETGLMQQHCSDCGALLAEETVAKLICGDANKDGTVDSLDLVRMKKELLAHSSYLEKDLLDINQDGAFDIRDLVRLKKQLAGA